MEMSHTMSSTPVAIGKSYFDGSLADFIGRWIVGALITCLTFGICAPWAVCLMYEWKINHTVIEGRRLKFTGKAVNLFGHWIKWIFLTVITFGIYGWWLIIALEKWKVENTTFQS